MATGDRQWEAQAKCGAEVAEALFVEGTVQKRVKTLCSDCPVRTECLAYALDNRIEHGIWGGTTARERRSLLRRRPTVTSWRLLLDAARTEHAHSGRLLPLSGVDHRRTV
ncbi:MULTISPECIES: WhiB family transcriptional regulator [Streptomyces]|uniref:WhiB family transcriptional regulator n=1 Tax=Streptomyces TaxID=1883 RepID=UPI0016785DCC|nr:WhiB family transcriptional regulator [Streptomyces canarius]